MPELAAELLALNSILFHDALQLLIATQRQRSELVVIPLFIKDFLNHRIEIATKGMLMKLGTLLADINAQPNYHMGGVPVAVIEAFFIVGILQFLL